MNAPALSQIMPDVITGDTVNGQPTGTISWEAITTLAMNPQDCDKTKAAWVIPSTWGDSRTKADQIANGEFVMLVADIDDGNHDKQAVIDAAKAVCGDSAFLVYATKSSKATARRWRLFVPLANALNGAEYVAASKAFTGALAACGLVGDACTSKPAQIMFLPNRGEHYDYYRQAGKAFAPPARWLVPELPKAPTCEVVAPATGSVIDEFKRRFSVEDVLQRAGWKQNRAKLNEWDRPDSTGFSASVADGRVTDQSSNSPLYGHGHDAFSAFCMLFHNGDTEAAMRDAAAQLGMQAPAKAANDTQPPVVTELLERKGPALAEVSLLDVMSAKPEPVRFAVNPYFPVRHVSLFGGHGGIGKSQLALAMAAHVACGKSFDGLEVEQRKVLFVSLEDEPSVVRLRLRKLIDAYQLDPDEVLPNMRLLDGTGSRCALFTEGEGYGARALFTPAFSELVKASEGFGLIVVDNASDAFDANENQRREVKGFITGLAALARKCDAAVVLLAHIDKAAARGGSVGNSYSGSTAWHNSVRSRCALMTDSENEGVVNLDHEKCNLAPLAERKTFAFVDGVLMPEGGANGEMLTKEHFDQQQIIRCFEYMAEIGHNVPDNLAAGGYSAMATMERLVPDYPFKGKAKKARAAQAIAKLKAKGTLVVQWYKDENRKQKSRLVLSGTPEPSDE